jgi:hypothetical protein
VRRVRLKMKSDVDRPVRIELGGTYPTTMGTAPRFGWEATATAAGSTVTLDVSALAVARYLTPSAATVNQVLQAVSQIYVMAQATNRDATTGLMPAGTSQKGWLQIDDVELLSN